MGDKYNEFHVSEKTEAGWRSWRNDGNPMPHEREKSAKKKLKISRFHLAAAISGGIIVLNLFVGILPAELNLICGCFMVASIIVGEFCNNGK